MQCNRNYLESFLYCFKETFTDYTHLKRNSSFHDLIPEENKTGARQQNYLPSIKKKKESTKASLRTCRLQSFLLKYQLTQLQAEAKASFEKRANFKAGTSRNNSLHQSQGARE